MIEATEGVWSDMRWTAPRARSILLPLLVVACLALAAGPAQAVDTFRFLAAWPTPADLNYPNGIAVSPTNGNVYVADSGNNQIIQYTPDGTRVRAWSHTGDLGGTLNMPYGVTCDSAGNVYVADLGNNVVQKYAGDGGGLAVIGTPGDGFEDGDGELCGPYAVAVDSSGNIYVTDNYNYRVQKFSAAGSYVTQWGSQGTGDGQFNSPNGLDVDGSGNVYVADGVNNRIQKFTSSGSYVTGWGPGTGAASISVPCGVAVDDSTGNVFVADSWNHRIQQFDSTGLHMGGFGSMGTGDGYFQQPEGIAVASNNLVFVADTQNFRVQKFERLTAEDDTDPPVTTSNVPAPWQRASQFQVQLTVVDSSTIAGTYCDVDEVGMSSYSGPFWVFDSGIHPVRFYSVDSLGNREATQTSTLKLDADPPVTSSNLSGWYGGPKTVSLSATDPLAGLYAIHFTIDGSAEATYASPFLVSGEGIHPVTYWSEDVLGNTETLRNDYVRIDLTAPVTTATVPSWVSPAYPLTLIATDTPGSGVNWTVYEVPGSPTATYTVPFDPAVEGSVTVQFRSGDEVNNVEATKSVEVRVDNTPPVTTSDLLPVYIDNAVIHLDATDLRSGPALTAYRIDGAAWQYGLTAFVNGIGVHNIEYGSTDVAGNVETTQVYEFAISTEDYVPPNTLAHAPADWVHGPVDVTLEASDNPGGGGVYHTYYRWQPDGPLTVYNGTTLTVDGSGIYYLDFYSTDLALNREATDTAAIRVDNDAPETTATIASIYTDSASISLVATDAHSGVDHVRYVLDGGALTTGTLVTTTKSGPHTLEYAAIDIVGNVEATQSAAFTVLSRAEQNSPALVYEKTWVTEFGTGLTGWYWKYTDTPGALAHLTFQGTRFELITKSAPNHGWISVSIDGGAPTYWDLYSSSPQTRRSFYLQNLADTTHHVHIAYTGLKNPLSSGYRVGIDAIDVDGGLVIDTVPPSTSATAPSAWTSAAVVTLNATETHNYVAASYLQIAGVTSTYTGPRLVTNEGTQTVAYWSVDGGGNVEATKTVTVRVDRTAPTVSDDHPVPWQRTSVEVHPSFTDTYSAVAYTGYSLNGGQSWTPIAGGAYTLSAEGTNTVRYRAVDALGNESTSAVSIVRIDGTPPESTATAPSGWTTSAATVTLSATDAVSGVAETSYTVTGEARTLYSGPFQIAQEGVRTVSFASLDSAGNVETTKSVTVRVDLTPPYTSAPQQDAYLGSASVALTPSDGGLGSGVASTEWRLDGGTWVQGSLVQTSQVGHHVLEYRSTDVAGLTEDVRTLEFDVLARFGQDAPALTHRGAWLTGSDGGATDGTYYYGNAPDGLTVIRFNGTRCDLRLMAGQFFGIPLVTVDGGDPVPVDLWAPSQTYISWSTGQLSPGFHSVRLAHTSDMNPESYNTFFSLDAVDVAGTLVADTVPPVTTAQVPEGWVPTATVTLTVDEPETYVAATLYRVAGGPVTTYTAPFEVSAPGTRTIEYWSIDGAGNVETTQSAQVYVDRTAPVVTPAAPSGWVSGTAAVSLGVTDDASGVSWVRYGIWPSASPDTTYGGPFTVSGEGTVPVTFEAMDVAGNLTTGSIGVHIDNTAPESYVPSPQMLLQPASFPISIAEYGSGAATTQWRVDGGEWQTGETVTNAGLGHHTLDYRTTDLVGNVEETRWAEFYVLQRCEEDSGWFAYTGTWDRGLDPTASGGGYAFSDDASAAAKVFFDGTFGRVLLPYGPDLGIARVTFDGGYVTDLVDLYSPERGSSWYQVDGLSLQYDTFEIAATGLKNPASTGTRIAFDAFDADGEYTSDAEPPVSNASFPQGWVHSGLVEIDAQDAGTYLAGTAYRLDGGPVTTYTASFEVSAAGPLTLEYWSIDVVGNREATKTLELLVDGTPPSVTASGPAGWVQPPATVTLDATDTYSGAEEIRYSATGGVPSSLYVAPFSVSAEGVNTVTYLATDQAGNASAVESITVRVDGTPPFTSAAAPSSWVTASAVVTLTASDALSGVDATYYLLDGVPQAPYSIPFVVSKEGTTLVQFDSVDEAGNLEELREIIVRVDSRAPTTTSDVRPSYGGTATIALTATDEHSGVTLTEWRLDGGAWQTGTSVVTEDPGQHTLEFRSSDVAGNTEATREAAFLVMRRYDQADGRMVYAGTWSTPDDPEMVGGTSRQSSSGGAKAFVTFDGTRIDLVGPEGPAFGRARIWLDGVDLGVVDQYDSTYSPQAVLWSSGVIGGGEHQLRVDVLNDKDPLSGATTVALDAADVDGTLLQADSDAPQTTDDAPTVWVRDDVSVTLTATDALTGVGATFFRRDAGAVATYTGPISVTATGTTTLSYWSVDLAGNVEQTRTATVRIDKSAPLSSSDTTTTWLNGPVSATLSSVDDLSGVDETYYRVDDGAVATYGAPFAISAEGTTTLRYWSVDAAGNAEATITAYVHIDDTAPSTSDDATSTWQQGPVSVTLSPTDAHSGIAHTYYRLAGGPVTEYASPVAISAEGTSVLQYWSVDVAGNSETTGTATVRIDDTAPSTTDDAPTGWVDGDVTIALTPADALSGADETYYRVGETTVTAYAAPFTITAEGTTVVSYWSTDAAGNAEASQTATVRIDRTAPSSSDDATSTWLDGPVAVTISTVDALSGTDEVYYRLGTGDAALYTGPVAVSAEGTNTLAYWSVDEVGNAEATKTATVLIDETAPVSSDDATSTWQRGPVAVTLGSGDPLSGVAHTYYQLDAGPVTEYVSAIAISDEGTNTLRYWSVDAVGHAEVTRTATVRIDDTAPVSSDDATSTWQQGPVSVTLDRGDALSGVAHTYYRLAGGEVTEYVSPISVLAEGTSVLEYWSTDAAGNVEATQTATVCIDDTAPVSSDDATSTWQQGPVTVTLGADDALSGVSSRFYRLGGGPVTPYTGPVVVSDEGTSTLSYWSEDAAGNVEETRTATVRVDDTAPLSSDDATSSWQQGPVSVTLGAGDAHSGVAATYYRLNAGPVTEYGTPVQVTAEGTNTIRYWSVDLAGNVEATESATVRIDETAPESSDDAAGTWVDGPVDVTISTEDTMSGVGEVYYRLGDGPAAPYTGPVTVSDEGVNTLAYWSIDEVGNAETTKTATVRIDETAPGTAHDVGADWSDATVTVSLTASDALSGVAHTYYRLGEGPLTEYTGPFPVSAEGTTLIEFRSVDAAGHGEATRSATVRIDRTAPATGDDAPEDWVGAPVSVTLTPADGHSGVSHTYYRLADGPVTEYASPVAVSAEGTSVLEYWSVDQVGNVEATNTTNVRIDLSAPVTTSNAQASSYTGTATIVLTPTDVRSGLAGTAWRVDGAAWSTGTVVTIGGSALGTHSVEWLSADRVGNVEATRSATVRVVLRVEQDDAHVSYGGTWSQPIDANMSGGNARFTSVAGNAVNLGFTGTSFDWIGPKGASYGLAKVTLDGSIETTVDLYCPTLQYKQVVWTSGTLANGRHNVRIEVLGQKGLGSGTGVTLDAFDVVGSLSPIRYEQDNAALTYSGTWSQNSDVQMSGGTYKFTSVTSSTVELAFWGKSAEWIGPKGGSYGIARVSVDGGAPVSVDLYNPALLYRQAVWSSGTLTEGAHTVRIEATGLKNPSSSGAGFTVDAFDVVGYPTPLRFEQDDKTVSYTGTWSLNSDSGMSGGNYRFSSVTSSTVDLSFWGKSIEWIGAKGTSYGIAQVSVDGGAPVMVDAYNPSLRYRQMLWSSGTLSEGRHSVRIEVTGSKNTSSSGVGIVVDSLDVVGGLIPRRHEQDHATLAFAGTWSQNSDSGMSGGSYKFTSVASSTVDLTFWGKSIEWIGAKGTSYGIAQVSVDGGAPVMVDAYNPSLRYRQSLWSSGLLSDGLHTVRIEATGLKNASSGGTGLAFDAFDVAGYVVPRRFEQDDAMTSYSGTWGQNADSGMSGGSYKYSSTAASVLNVTFNGTGFDWIAAKGASFGMAKVTLDGSTETTVDLYSPSLRYRQVVWGASGLADGQHTVRIEVLGQKRAAATGTNVHVDAFDVVHSLSTRRTDQTDPTLGWSGTWQQNSDAGMYGGSYRISQTTGSVVTVSFRGKSLDWIGAKGPGYGLARVSVDGSAETTVDAYGSALQYRRVLWSSGQLSDALHTVRITVTGQKNASSSGRNIVVDAFDVLGAMVQQDSAPPSTASNATASYTGTATITLSPTDDASGVEATYYRLNGGGWTAGTSVTTTTVGDHLLEFYSVDRAGNVEATKSASFAVLRRFEEADPGLTYFGTWGTNADGGMSGGAYRNTVTQGAAVEATFTGTRIDWIAPKGSGYGIGRVFLDGTEHLVDLYAPSLAYRQRVWTSGELAPGTHTIRIEYTNTKNDASAGTRIILDALDVNGAIVLP